MDYTNTREVCEDCRSEFHPGWFKKCVDCGGELKERKVEKCTAKSAKTM